jgi:hypothetical protein
VNDPGVPQQCSQEVWMLQIMGFLCREGQTINWTWDSDGAPPMHANTSAAVVAGNPPPPGTDARFDPRPDSRMVRDGHGYRMPIDTPSTDTQAYFNGPIKSHDNWLIHWTDHPGGYRVPSDLFKPVASWKDHYFHAYVHGSSGRDEDNCDCYMSVRTAVAGTSGRAGPSSAGQPECR